MSETLAMTEEERLIELMGDHSDEILESLRAGEPVKVLGPTLSAAAWMAADWAHQVNRPLIFVVPTSRDARQAASAVATVQSLRGSGEVHHLPAPDVSPYGAVSADKSLHQERMKVQAALPTLAADSAVVMPAAAWLRRVAPLVDWNEHRITLSAGDEYDPAELGLQLATAGYRSVAVVEEPASFSVRMGIVDFWPPLEPKPVRLDFFGDELESIREIDPLTQRSGRVLESVTITAATEDVVSDKTNQKIRERLSSLGAELRAPSMRITNMIKEAQAGLSVFGAGALLPARYDSLVPITELLPPQPLVVFYTPSRLRNEQVALRTRSEEEYERSIATDEIVFKPEEYFWLDDSSFADPAEEVAATVLRFEEPRDEPSDEQINVGVLDNRPLVRARKDRSAAAYERGQRAAFDLLGSWFEHYGRVLVVAGSPAGARRVDDLARRFEIPSIRREGIDDLSDIMLRPAQAIEIVVGPLHEGFRYPARSLVVATDREILGKSGRRSASEEVREATTISSFKELQPGDLVVHTDFGIGSYTGLVKMDAGGFQSDFLGIEYAGKDRLYVPVYRLGQVQKYVGSQTFIKLDKLGGSSWERTKARVKKQLADVAEELLLVQAERSAREGRKFGGPNEDYYALEASFPFEETPHQLQAIEEILADMQRPQPMDRLLCGDVGFGKTEVAVRAAYKAILDGAQVAILVPTTVLAEQHFKTFKARLANTAARVEVLNRFRSRAEIRQTLDDTREGKVDILIGTHRILSKDVEFKDLGLLVVDEEQRFGVTHKEKIKQLRSSVDVLTMTATPIPRTLELSLLGLRDLSVIMTPPPGRLAVQTHLARHSEAAIREAILFELGRGGQVYIVHNRVADIVNVAEEIARIVPDAKVGVGHAQMSDDELEQVMISFVQREIDVLVSTTIIESGIDIATANTIIIQNADRFGLSQLYQLRGRVGRGNDRGVCLLLVRDVRNLADGALQRLEVLQQNSKLGSGLAIAQQDLDMRGAGNLLGRGQSGHIEAIGFELYAELLAEAVAELKGEALEIDEDPEVKLPVPGYIPEDYVEDVGQRLGFYKRMSGAKDWQSLVELVYEIEDRYGTAPDEVTQLRDILGIKLMLRRMGATQLEGGPKGLSFDLQEHTDLEPAAVMQLIEDKRGEWEFKPPMRVVVSLPGLDTRGILNAAWRACETLLSCLPADL